MYIFIKKKIENHRSAIILPGIVTYVYIVLVQTCLRHQPSFISYFPSGLCKVDGIEIIKLINSLSYILIKLCKACDYMLNHVPPSLLEFMTSNKAL